jgi:hypothetical protein
MILFLFVLYFIVVNKILVELIKKKRFSPSIKRNRMKAGMNLALGWKGGSTFSLIGQNFEAF